MFNKHLEAQNCTWNKDFHHFLKFPSLVFLDFLEIGTEMIFSIERCWASSQTCLLYKEQEHQDLIFNKLHMFFQC